MEHQNFLNVSATLVDAQNLITEALAVLEEFYGPEQRTKDKSPSKASLLRGIPHGVEGGITTILGTPTKYAKQDCDVVQHLMDKFRLILATRQKEVQQSEQEAATRYQRSENDVKMARTADEKSLNKKKHAKSILEASLAGYQQQKPADRGP